MNATVAQLINEQINKEFYSAYLYLDFANYYAAAGLDGFENWYRVQAQEERDHALLFFQYLLNNGVAVSFGAVDAPDWTRGDHMTPLKKALEHEQYVTSLINGIYAAAYDDRDFRTMQLLDWFVKEQGEEEKTPPISSRKWSFSARTPRACTCSTASSRLASTRPRRSCCKRIAQQKAASVQIGPRRLSFLFQSAAKMRAPCFFTQRSSSALPAAVTTAKMARYTAALSALPHRKYSPPSARA